jgi:hypothetical protein
MGYHSGKSRRLINVGGFHYNPITNERKTKMDLIEFRNHILAERMAEIKEKRNNNLTAILSVANATISDNNERKEN